MEYLVCYPNYLPFTSIKGDGYVENGQHHHGGNLLFA